MKKLENIRVNGDDILGKQSAQIEPLDEDAKLFYQEDIESQKKNADVISLNSNQSLQEALLCEGDIPLSSTPEKWRSCIWPHNTLLRCSSHETCVETKQLISFSFPAINSSYPGLNTIKFSRR